MWRYTNTKANEICCCVHYLDVALHKYVAGLLTVSSLLISTGGASVTKYRLVDNSYGRFCPSADGKHTLLESMSFQNGLTLIAVDMGLSKWNTKWVVGSWSNLTTYKFNSKLEKASVYFFARVLSVHLKLIGIPIHSVLFAFTTSQSWE